MPLEKYDKSLEKKWHERWERERTYAFDPKDTTRPIYSIDSPPPFTSGDLHMGHVLSYAYFDFVARFKRMRGYNVYYPQGWDCQGFPTEVRVEAKFGRNLPRAEFRKHCVAWTEEYIKRMRGQMNAMGLSPDWRYEYRTMDPSYHKLVQYSLLKMHEKKLIYRGEHPVFWCPHCASAIAKAETEEAERETTLNYVRFKFAKPAKGVEHLTIATTRPELLHACVAVFVHPEDERYKKYVGKELVVPVFGQTVKIMTDADVDKEFGTGIVMVCTFGDKMDAVWAYRHKLKIIKSMDERGRLINAGVFNGLKAKEARAKILDKLKHEGALEKSEKLKQVIKVHDRCDHPIELILSAQWFAKLKGFEDEIVRAAKTMRWVPEFTIQYLIDWANYIEWDWVISRQRAYGTPIPFWYCEKCGEIITPKYDELPVNPPDVKKKCRCGGEATGESAVCDCWVDSSITPLVISRWTEDEEFFAKTYPSSLRPQGTEIIRTWAFYTIYRCLMLTSRSPFKELLLNGNVLAPDGKKMSKSLGNVIPPDSLIQQYSADAVRQWVALSGALAKDRPFSYKDIQFAQTFINKLWNASRFVESALKDYKHSEKTPKLRACDRWILSRLNRLTKSTTENFENFDFHAVLTAVHEFFWHEFCDYYLEDVKHRLYQQEVYGEESKRAAQYTLNTVLLGSLKLLAPIISFATEEIYHEVFAAREKSNSIHLSKWPSVDEKMISEDDESAGALLNKIIAEIRKFKADNKMPLNAEVEKVSLSLSKEEAKMLKLIEEEIKAVGRAKKIESRDRFAASRKRSIFRESEKLEGEFKVEVKK
ncbi:MAG: valine--tRNA ligase [Candidatus Micrarchaeota archaeon]